MALGLRKLCPAKRAWSPSSSSILGCRGARGVATIDLKKKKKKKRVINLAKLLQIVMSLQAVNTHLMS